MARNYPFGLIQSEVELPRGLNALPIQVNDILFGPHPQIRIPHPAPVHLQPARQNGAASFGARRQAEA